MKKYLSYGFILGIFVISGITPAIISSNNLRNTIQKNSDLNTKAAGDSIAPMIDSFEWTAGSSATEEDFTIILSDSGSYYVENYGYVDFNSTTFDTNKSSISFESDAGTNTKNTDFDINNWKYTDAKDNVDSDKDQITGTATVKAGKTYENIILTLNYNVSDGFNGNYSFTSGGNSPDLDIGYNGESFTREILPSFTLTSEAQWNQFDNDSAMIPLKVNSWGKDENGNAFTEEDLNSELSYVTYDDWTKTDVPYKWVDLELTRADPYNEIVYLKLSNLRPEKNYTFSSIHLVFGDSDEKQYDSVVMLEDGAIPSLKIFSEKGSVYLGGGAIFGIVLGSLIVLGLIEYLIYYFIVKNKKDNDLTKEETEIN